MATIDGLKKAPQVLEKQKWINKTRRIFEQALEYFADDTFARKMKVSNPPIVSTGWPVGFRRWQEMALGR